MRWRRNRKYIWGMAMTDTRVHVRWEIKAPTVTVMAFFFPGDPVTFMTYVSSHLDRVTDDYFSRDPVSDTVSICEQLLEVAVWWPLTYRQTAALCWRNMQRHIPGVEKQIINARNEDRCNDKLITELCIILIARNNDLTTPLAICQENFFRYLNMRWCFYLC